MGRLIPAMSVYQEAEPTLIWPAHDQVKVPDVEGFLRRRYKGATC